MSHVTIRLLGGFDAAVDGVPVAAGAWRLRKARELVKLLALAPGRSLHREQVMDVLWQEQAPAAAANNLYQAVHAARRALGADVLEVRDEMVTLAAEIDVDVDAFERAAVAAEQARTAPACRAALDLYAGELLPENRYDDWAADARERLAALHDRLAVQVAELGAGIRSRLLPTDASSFVGRGHELGELRAQLARARLLTLAGTGGAGKTRLGLELARAAQGAFADGAVLVELAGVSDPATVPIAVAAALDVRGLPDQTPVEAICDFLGARTLLLMVDNCEHLIGASAALVGAVLRTAPGVTVLATSREPLRVPGEVVFRVPSLAIPDPSGELGPAELLRYEAVELFVDRAEAALPGFVLDERNATDVARICFRLDGLPLALELAAGRLGGLSPSAIAERLDDRFRLLQSGSRTAPTRQQTLLATLNWSHDLLEEDERRLFRRLAAFSGGFGLDAVEDVCASDDLPRPAVADVLARLVAKSLVAAGEVDDEWRYALLDTMAAYAAERLAEAGEAGDVARRHVRWATDLAAREGTSPRLDREAANLRRALNNSLATDPHAALELCVAVWPFWLRRIDLGEAQRRFAAALDAAPERSVLRVEALRAAAAIDLRAGSLVRGAERAQEAYEIATGLGRLEWRALQFVVGFAAAIDDFDQAAARAEDGLTLARREGFAAGEALSIYTLGVARWLAGDLEGADTLLTDSLERFRALESEDELIPSLLNISEVRTTDTAADRVVFEDTLQPFVEVSCSAATGWVLANQATIARLRGDAARARALLDASAARFAELGDQRGEASVLARRAFLVLAEGDAAGARSCLEQALDLRSSLNDRRGVGLALSGLGLVDTVAGDYARAERELGEACDLFRRAGDRWGLSSSLWRVADLARERGRLDEAWSALQEARRVVSETRRNRWLGHTDAALAEVALLQGDRELGASLLSSARDEYAEAKDEHGVAAVEHRLAEIAKTAQRARKGTGGTNGRKRTTKGRPR